MNSNRFKSIIIVGLIAVGLCLNSSVLKTNSLEENIQPLNEYLSEIVLSFNETKAYEHIVTQLNFGFRVPGTTAHLDCANWIRSELLTTVSSVETHNFEIQKNGQPSYSCQNILGKINTDEKNIVILAAHWDSRNVAEKDTVNITQPIPGANDGGSGVGVLLELARILSLYENELNSQFWFLFFDAEDQGLSGELYGLQDWDWAEGSKEFAENINNFFDSSSETIDCFILLDMVGGTNLEFVREVRSDDDLHNSIFNEGRMLGFNSSFPLNPVVKAITDDHLAFHELGIPVIDLVIDFNGGEWLYHHTHSDDLSHIDPASLNITGRTIESFVKRYYTSGTEETWKLEEEETSISILSIIVSICIFRFGRNCYRRRRRNINIH